MKPYSTSPALDSIGRVDRWENFKSSEMDWYSYHADYAPCAINAATIIYRLSGLLWTGNLAPSLLIDEPSNVVVGQ